MESEILVKRAIGIFLIVISSLLGQIDSFYISPEGGETTSVLNDYYAGAQQYYTTGCDDNLNFAVAYFIPGHEGSIFFALYKKSGKEILTKLIPLDSNTETAIPHIALAGNGKGVLTILKYNTSGSSVLAFQFETNGTFNKTPVNLNLDLGSSSLMGIDISQNLSIVISWLKEAGSFTADTLFTQFFDYNLYTIKDKQVTTSSLNSDEIMRIKHQFREDNSSMVFVLYGEKNEGTKVNHPSKCSFINFDSQNGANTSLNTVYFPENRAGADVSIGEPGVFYTAEIIAYDPILEYGELNVYKRNLKGIKTEQHKRYCGVANDCTLDFKDRLLFMHYNLSDEKYISIYNTQLTPYVLYGEVCPTNKTTGSNGVRAAAGGAFLVSWNEVVYENDTYLAQLKVRTGKNPFQLFCEPIAPHSKLRREGLKLLNTVNGMFGNIATFYKNFAFDKTGAYTIFHVPPFPRIATSTVMANMDLNGTEVVKLVYNNGFSSLNYSWRDQYWLHLNNYESHDAIPKSIILENHEYSIGEYIVIPSGEEDFILIYQKKNRTHDKHSLVAIKYDKRLNVLIDSLKIEAYLDETTHFSSDITVGRVDHKNYIFWSYCDSTKSNSTVKMRIFNEFYIVNDTTIITFKHPENKFLHPKKVFFDKNNKPCLAVVVSDSYNSETGKLEYWRILEDYYGNYYYEVFENVIDEVSRVKDCVKLEDDQYLFTYTDAGSDKEMMRILTPERGFISPEYYLTDFTETYTNGNYNVNYSKNNIILQYDGVYTEEEVSVKAIAHRVLKIANIMVEDTNNVSPEDFVIYQNYPNPFNPSTNINFAIPESGKVKFDVYNTLGELIYDPVETDYENGNHTIKFDGTGYSSGIYLYKLTFGAKSKAGKMILLK